MRNNWCWWCYYWSMEPDSSHLLKQHAHRSTLSDLRPWNSRCAHRSVRCQLVLRWEVYYSCRVRWSMVVISKMFHLFWLNQLWVDLMFNYAKSICFSLFRRWALLHFLGLRRIASNHTGYNPMILWCRLGFRLLLLTLYNWSLRASLNPKSR